MVIFTYSIYANNCDNDENGDDDGDDGDDDGGDSSDIQLLCSDNIWQIYDVSREVGLKVYICPTRQFLARSYSISFCLHITTQLSDSSENLPRKDHFPPPMNWIWTEFLTLHCVLGSSLTMCRCKYQVCQFLQRFLSFFSLDLFRLLLLSLYHLGRLKSEKMW